MIDSKTVRAEQHVRATPSEVFRAFIHARSLREWFSQEAFVSPREGGHIWLGWSDDGYAAGEFTELEPDRRIAFTWAGKDVDRPSSVRISLDPAAEGTVVTVEHGGLDGVSADMLEQLDQRWVDGLENLASVWGMTGNDLRITRRPLVGMYSSWLLVPAEGEGVPPGTTGFQVLNTMEGSAAEKAGLLPDDIVVRLGDRPMVDQGSFATALRQFRAGEKGTMIVVRNGKLMDLGIVFGTRPTPPVAPEKPAELAGVLKDTYDKFESELDEILEGIDDGAAGRRPEEHAWSIKEVLAHLIPAERGFHDWISAFLIGEEVRVFSWNHDLRRESVLAAYPTLASMRDVLRKTRERILFMVERLPEEFVRTPTYVRMAQDIQVDQAHPRTHLAQIRRIAEAVRSAGES